MDACFHNPAGLCRETRDSISIDGALYGMTASVGSVGENVVLNFSDSVAAGAPRRHTPRL